MLRICLPCGKDSDGVEVNNNCCVNSNCVEEPEINESETNKTVENKDDDNTESRPDIGSGELVEVDLLRSKPSWWSHFCCCFIYCCKSSKKKGRKMADKTADIHTSTKSIQAIPYP